MRPVPAICRAFFKEADLRRILLKVLFPERKKYAIITIIVVVITYFICSFIKIEGIIGLLIKGFVCFIVSNILFFVAYKNFSEFDETRVLIKKMLKIGK